MTDLPRSPADNPFRLNLDQQKKRAKELLRLFAEGDEGARQRVFSKLGAAEARPLKLADSQFVIARELGLSSWPKLKAHIGEMEAARDGLAKTVPLDQDMPTLHIRCGNDIAQVLPLAGLHGDFLEVSDPLVMGPVTEGPDWLERRADFLEAAFGKFNPGSGEKLRHADEKLRKAAQSHERVVLWFEHDSYDQLLLIYVLSVLAEEGLPARLELATAGHFPGTHPFWGLGQLPPEALRLLWQRRAEVTPAQLACAREVWRALRVSSPDALSGIAGQEDLPLPFLARALRRHLAELPGTGDGLSLTQRFALESLSEGVMTAGQVFRTLMLEREPLPWLGDLMFWVILKEMAAAGEPPLRLSFDHEEEWPHAQAELTEAGHELLAGKRDYLDMAPPRRWVGGTEIDPSRPAWRWDAALGRVRSG